MTGNQFQLKRLEEPSLVFAGDGEKKDPRAGILEYGPCPRSTEDVAEVVNVGIVGDSRSISMMEGLLRAMRGGIESRQKRKRWKPPFPGLGVDSRLGFDYQLVEQWKGRIRDDKMEALEDVRGRDERAEFAFKHLKYQIQSICNTTPSPDVIFVTIPERIVEACSDPRTDTSEIRTENGNFRSRIKIAGMEKHTPTQLMSPQALRDSRDVQERSEVAWNVAVGMLYKARRGRPWKLGKLRNQTCYAGISFFRERGDDPEMRASVAQVFIPDGRHFVIRGDPVEDVASDEPQTHLSYEDAKTLVEDILENYGSQMDERPRRLVLHKSSNFLDDEARGFHDGAKDVPEKDFITIRKKHPLRIFPPTGDHPALRGTLAIPPGEKEYYLYTKGYVPEHSVYNDPGTPNPIVIRPHSEYYTGDYNRVCDEILAFTKLDWNSSDFCKRSPVTIGIADAVSDILAEPEASDVNLETHYYYYM